MRLSIVLVFSILSSAAHAQQLPLAPDIDGSGTSTQSVELAKGAIQLEVQTEGAIRLDPSGADVQLGGAVNGVGVSIGRDPSADSAGPASATAGQTAGGILPPGASRTTTTRQAPSASDNSPCPSVDILPALAAGASVEVHRSACLRSMVTAGPEIERLLAEFSVAPDAFVGTTMSGDLAVILVAPES